MNLTCLFCTLLLICSIFSLTNLIFLRIEKCRTLIPELQSNTLFKNTKLHTCDRTKGQMFSSIRCCPSLIFTYQSHWKVFIWKHAVEGARSPLEYYWGTLEQGREPPNAHIGGPCLHPHVAGIASSIMCGHPIRGDLRTSLDTLSRSCFEHSLITPLLSCFSLTPFLATHVLFCYRVCKRCHIFAGNLQS